jgi:hypothetical protein
VSDLEEGGFAVGETALLLDDEDGARLEALELQLDDTRTVGVEDEVGNDDATMDIQDFATDIEDGVEDAGLPIVAASVNKLVVLPQQLGSPQHQLSTPHFLTGALSSCHYTPSAPWISISNNSTHHTFVTYTRQALCTLPRRICTPLSPPQSHTLVRPIECFVVLAQAVALTYIVCDVCLARALVVGTAAERIVIGLVETWLVRSVRYGTTVAIVTGARGGCHRVCD